MRPRILQYWVKIRTVGLGADLIVLGCFGSIVNGEWRQAEILNDIIPIKSPRQKLRPIHFTNRHDQPKQRDPKDGVRLRKVKGKLAGIQRQTEMRPAQRLVVDIAPDIPNTVTKISQGHEHNINYINDIVWFNHAKRASSKTLTHFRDAKDRVDGQKI